MTMGSPFGQSAGNAGPPGRPRRLPFGRELTGGLVAGLLGLVLNFESLIVESTNGIYNATKLGLGVGTESAVEATNQAITQCSYTNYAPLLLGAAAGIAGILAIIRARRPDRKTGLEIGLAALCLVLCAVDITRGLGIIGGPCP